MKYDYNNLFDLNGKVAVVTGGSGILGTEFCSGLAAHGASVVVTDIDEQKAKEVADYVNQNFSVEAIAVLCDVSSPQSVESMVAKTMERFGSIDILLNNAATKTDNLEAYFAPFDEYRLETWRAIMSVNIDGMFLVAQAVSKIMKQQHLGGSIVQTASIYGVSGPDPRIYEGSRYLGRQINTPAAYSTSKGAVIAFTRHLATTLAPYNIRVNTITPGGVESGQNDTFSQKYSTKVPLARMAFENEMVGAMLFLASGASSYVTGQNLIVDGGKGVW